MGALKYTGGGFKGSMQGIPARDLTAEEVKQYGGEKALLETRLYKKAKGGGSQDKSVAPSENK